MEKKKLLLVAISVGVFLALTIGAAILFFAPKEVPAATMAAVKSIGAVDTGITVPAPASSSGPSVSQDSTPQSSSLDPVELVNATPGLRQVPEGTAKQGEDFYINGNNGGNNGGTGKTTETVISVPKPTTAAVPDTPPAGKAASTTATAQTAVKPAAAAVPVAAAVTVSTAAQTQAKPASVQTKVYNDYWVQTGAFSTIARAESVKKTLSDKGITSIIENSEVNGKTVFRVRVGPYTSQNEANYWLSLIKSISGFEDSQVRQTQSVR